MTTVVHKDKKPHDVYIGRGTIFGNPYKIGIDGTRTEVIALYEKHIRTRMAKSPEVFESVIMLKDKVLGCHCKPLGCHGDVLVKIVEELEVKD
jgi:hypothetical protein